MVLEATAENPLGPRLLSRVARTSAGKAVALVGSLAAVVITSRVLGPEGRGLVALSTSVSPLAAQLFTMGVGHANHYYGAKYPDKIDRLLGNSLALTALIALVVGVLCLCRPLQLYLHLPASIFWVTLLIIIPQSLAFLVSNLVAALGRLNLINATDAAISLSLAAFVLIYARSGTPSPLLVISFRLAVTCVCILFLVKGLCPPLHSAPRLSKALFREGLGASSRFFGAGVIDQMLRSFDLILVHQFLGDGPTGLYAAVATLVALQGILPATVSAVLFPRLTTLDSFKARCRAGWPAFLACAGLALGSCCVTGLLAPFLIKTIFGIKFIDAAPALLWSLPGAWAMALQQLMATLFGSVGLPKSFILTGAAALLVNVSLDLILIPGQGIVGAAIAASIGYTVYLGLTLLLIAYFLREEKS